MSVDMQVAYESISIHAPAGGATVLNAGYLATTFISIHAPAGGATSERELQSQTWRFQFTPLREGRRA